MKRNGWVVISLVCLAASIVSLFTTVIVYADGGMRTTYNIIDLILYQDFADSVLSYYSGQAFLGISDGLVAVLAVIGVAAIICSLIGIITMRGKQYRDLWPFVLALVGLIGTMIPSVAIVLGIVLSQQFFPGTISCGIYPIVTMIAMIVCIITVTWRRKSTKEERMAAKRAGDKIHRAGDL